MNTENDTFECPACRERIKIGATLCRFCRTDLRQGVAPPMPPQQAAPAPTPAPTPKPPTKILGSSPAAIVGAIIFIGALGVFAAWQMGAFRGEPTFKTQARVECAAGTCTIENLESQAHRVCWDFVSTCANGTKPTAKACVDVGPLGKSSRVLSPSDFTGMAACDREVSAQIVNVRMER